MGHQPPSSANSAPPAPSVLCVPDRCIKNTHSLGASRPVRPGGPLLCQASMSWQAERHLNGTLLYPGRPPPRFPSSPPLGKLTACWCRGLFLGVEGEGNYGKRDRELGRWSREAGERIFPTAMSPNKKNPAPS